MSWRPTFCIGPQKKRKPSSGREIIMNGSVLGASKTTFSYSSLKFQMAEAFSRKLHLLPNIFFGIPNVLQKFPDALGPKRTRNSTGDFRGNKLGRNIFDNIFHELTIKAKITFKLVPVLIRELLQLPTKQKNKIAMNETDFLI
jgi:hypothetical protein